MKNEYAKMENANINCLRRKRRQLLSMAFTICVSSIIKSPCPLDSDGDGIPDHLDTDDDGDGIPDDQEGKLGL